MRVYPFDVDYWRSAEAKPPPPVHRLDKPIGLSLWMVASPRSARFRFALRLMPDDKCVADSRHFEIQVPTKIFLSGLVIRSHAPFAKFADDPLGHIIAEREYTYSNCTTTNTTTDRWYHYDLLGNVVALTDS